MSEVTEAAPKAAKPAAVPKYRVTIHSGEDPSDKGDVVLAHNYHQIQIQRDKEVVIGENFLECLKHSVIEATVKDDGKEKMVRIPRFSFTSSPA